MTSSLGGGLVDGDDVALEVLVDAGATCVVTTQASTKVYKGTSSQRTSVRVQGDGAVLVVPDPVVPFRDARFAQVTRIELDEPGTLVLCDILTAGRIAYGERWSSAYRSEDPDSRDATPRIGPGLSQNSRMVSR